MAEFQVRAAADWSLAALSALLAESFAGYFYTITDDVPFLAQRIRAEQVDLAHSVVLLADDAPAGLALLGLRGERAWCGGFGVVPAWRGRGAAGVLLRGLLAQAQAAGASRFVLEVLTRNIPAIAAYQRGGLSITRDLLIVGWSRDAQLLPVAAPTAVCVPVTLHDILPVFGRLHAVAPAWQRDLPALAAKGDLRGLALREGGEVAAYVLFTARQSNARIEDFAATSVETGVQVLRALQQQVATIVSVNEPADSPTVGAFDRCGFRENDRQHEMVIDLVRG